MIISGGRYHLETTWLDMHLGCDFLMVLSLICFSAIASLKSPGSTNEEGDVLFMVCCVMDDFRCAAVDNERAYLLDGSRATFGVW